MCSFLLVLSNWIPRSTFELGSCIKMKPLYSQAFEGTTCSDSSESLTLMFLIMLSISVVGMVIIMLRSAMYPYKKVYASSSLDDEEDDEWEEYQAYLRYMTNFVTMWGGNNADDDDADMTKSGTYDTSSESASNGCSKSPNSVQHRILANSSTISSNTPDDEETPPTSPHTPLDDALFGRPQELVDAFDDNGETFEDEEQIPLSPPDSDAAATDKFRMYTPQTRELRGDSDSDDECTPLTPQNLTIHESGGGLIRRRFMTPDFLSPGTFRRWRRNDEEVVTNNDDELPETPLMVSPKGQENGVNYFSTIISPMRIEGNQGEGGSAKKE